MKWAPPEIHRNGYNKFTKKVEYCGSRTEVQIHLYQCAYVNINTQLNKLCPRRRMRWSYKDLIYPLQNRKFCNLAWLQDCSFFDRTLIVQ